MPEGSPSPQDDKRLKELKDQYLPARETSMGLSALGSAGIELGLVVVLLTLAGWWLDKRFSTAPWLLLVGALLGATIGMYRLIQQFSKFSK